MGVDKRKILFVCLGNICRSPAAEAIFKKFIEEKGLEAYFEIDSAGLDSYHIGEKADLRMRAYASTRGYNITSISRPINDKDYQYFDMIIGMDRSNVRALLSRAPLESHRDKIFLVTDFSSKKVFKEVPDPYYGGLDGFVTVVDILEDSLKALLENISPSIEQ